MTRTTIQDDQDAALYLYPEIGAVHSLIKRYLEGDAFRPEDLAWAGESWQGRLRAAGWKHWAMILPDKVVGRVVAKKVAVRFIDAGLDVRTFEDEASALEWLAALRDRAPGAS
jgi:hypothetical protein